MNSYSILPLIAAFILVSCSSPKQENDADASRKSNAKAFRWLSSHSAGDTEKEIVILDFCQFLYEKNYVRLSSICTQKGNEAVKKCNMFSFDHYLFPLPPRPSPESMEYIVSNELHVHSSSSKEPTFKIILTKDGNLWKVNNVIRMQ